MLDEGMPLLELRGVVKEYSAIQTPVRVLNGVDFTIDRGESAVILGPSGSGKSTLLNLMGTLDFVTAGRVCFRGIDVTQLNQQQLSELRNTKIGFVFQHHHLLPQCTVLENVLIPAIVNPHKRVHARERSLALLERVGLSHRCHHRPGELSGGERQRTAVVRALINSPELLLADEPTGALTEEAALALAHLLLELKNENNMAIVIVTHSRTIATLFGKTFSLCHGRLVAGEQ